MEMELDGSSLGQSFEKVGDYHTEEDMEKLRALGPLGPDETPAAESWLGVDAKSRPGLKTSTYLEMMRAFALCCCVVQMRSGQYKEDIPVKNGTTSQLR